MSVAFLAPHSGGPREPGDPPGIATAAAAPQYTNAFAACPCPRPPPSTRRTCRTSRSRCRLARRSAPCAPSAIQEAYQQRLESLLSVDDAVASIVSRAARERRARQHADPVHERQRLLPRRAPHPGRQGARLRALDPSAAVDARPGRAEGRDRQATRDQRRPGAHDPRRRGRHAPTGRGWPLAARAARRPRRGVGPGAADRGRQRPGADVQRAAQLPLEVRRAHRRRGRAVRPPVATRTS